MRRFLVVGCGGSGGATLAYMMDQLRSDLAAEGVDRLPRGWQFVHLDVPSGEESGPDGLGNVEGQGGRYIGMGPKAGSYADLDFAVSRKLAANRALGEIATWAPPRNPNAVATPPISVGAGQYRAVGRMITLNKLEALREGLSGGLGRSAPGGDPRRHGSDRRAGPARALLGQRGTDRAGGVLDGRRSGRVDGAGRVPGADHHQRAGSQADGGLHGLLRHLRLAAGVGALGRTLQRAGDARGRSSPRRPAPPTTTTWT